jgi:hypothetical protein
MQGYKQKGRLLHGYKVRDHYCRDTKGRNNHCRHKNGRDFYYKGTEGPGPLLQWSKGQGLLLQGYMSIDNYCRDTNGRDRYWGLQETGTITAGIHKGGQRPITKGIQRAGTIIAEIQTTGTIIEGIQRAGTIFAGIQGAKTVTGGIQRIGTTRLLQGYTAKDNCCRDTMGKDQFNWDKRAGVIMSWLQMVGIIITEIQRVGATIAGPFQALWSHHRADLKDPLISSWWLRMSRKNSTPTYIVK